MQSTYHSSAEITKEGRLAITIHDNYAELGELMDIALQLEYVIEEFHELGDESVIKRIELCHRELSGFMEKYEIELAKKELIQRMMNHAA